MAILIILMEHGLRLDWCHLNKQQDNIAVPGRYYVTLDGFGQRTIHNVLMHPYLVDEGGESRRNALMDYLPGSTTALITDLFCSPCGPNIRALVSHGSLDNLLFKEWQSESDSLNDAHYQWQVTHAVLVGLHLVASREQFDYRPVFSFAAISQERIDRTQDQLEVLCQMIQEGKPSNELDDTKIALLNDLCFVWSLPTIDPHVNPEEHLMADSLGLHHTDDGDAAWHGILPEEPTGLFH